MNDKIFTSVWRGLDPYREEDADSFFGRDTEADQLCSDVAQTPLCVVYGASGSGKTSLIRAGLFPRLRSCGFIPVYVLFDHSSTARPFAEQIKSAVLEAVKTAHCDTVEVCAPISNARQETLWEWFHRHEFVNAFRQTVRPVVVIDQFEEVFTVGEERGGTDALLSDIADLAENYVPDVVVRDMEKSEAGFGFTADEQNWRIVVGLREDFLPRLEERTQKLPVFRRTRFVVGAFRREQALEVVTGPGGTLCGREVAEAIVDAVGKTKAGASVTVEPALLSLFCMRLDRARQEASLDEITFSLVRDKGKDILNTFYEESMSGVSGKTRDILEDWLLTSSGFRDSMAIEDAEAEGAPREELARLVRDRLLHVEYRGGVRWLELSHDILAPVAREAKERHARKREMAHVKKKMNFFKRIAAFLFGGVVIFLVLLQVWWFVFNKPYSSVYRDFVRCWGNPVGIGTPLKEIEWRHRQYSYRLHRHGALWYWNLVRRRNPPSHRIEIINGQGELSQLCWFGTEFGTDDDEGEGDTGDATTLFDKLKTVCVITFEYDKTGRPECEKGWDKEGNHIWTKKYDQFFEGEADWKKQDARFSYVWPDGLPMPIKNGLQAFVRISYDEQGRESRRILLDAFGKIMKNTDGQESIAITYDKMGRLVSQSSQNLGEHGIGWTNILDKAGNTGMKVIYAPDWSSEEWVSFGTGGETDLHPTTEGIARHIHRFDSYGNEINIVYLGVDGCPITGPYGFSEIRMYYGEDGTRTQEDLLSWDEKGVLGFTNVQHMVVNRNANGDVTRECFFDMNDKPVAGANGVPVIKRRFEEHGLLAEEWYEDGYGNPATNAAGIAKTAYQYSNGLQRRSDEYALPNMGGVGGF